jgi:hypothetical protein
LQPYCIAERGTKVVGFYRSHAWLCCIEAVCEAMPSHT